MPVEIVTALAGSGPLGLIIWYLMSQQKAERDRLAGERSRRDEIDKDRIATDKALASALTALTIKIEDLGK